MDARRASTIPAGLVGNGAGGTECSGFYGRTFLGGIPTSRAAGGMWANFSYASANFCVTFLDAVFRGPTAFSFRPEFSLTGHLFRLMLGVCYWEWSVVSGQWSVGSGAKPAMALGPFTCSTLSRSAIHLPPPDIFGHFLPGTGDAARERGSLRWWSGERRPGERMDAGSGWYFSCCRRYEFVFLLYEFCFFLHVFCFVFWNMRGDQYECKLFAAK